MINLHECGFQVQAEIPCPNCGSILPHESNHDKINVLFAHLIEMERELNHLKTKVENMLSQDAIDNALEEMNDRSPDSTSKARNP